MAYDMTPINYATGADSPLQAFTQGAKVGSDLQTSNLQQQQQEIAIQQQKNYNTGAQQVIANGSHPQDMANFMLANPSFADPIAKAASLMDTAQKQAALTQLTPTMAAIYSGNYDVAAANMDKAKEAYLASGDNEKAANAGMWADMIRKSPSTAKFMMAGTLAAAGGPQQFAENFTKFADDNRKQDLHAPTVKTAQADATIKTAEADVAPQKAAGEAAKATGEGKTALAEGNAAPTTVSLKNAGMSAEQAQKAAQLNLEAEKAANDFTMRKAELKLKDPTFIPNESATKIINDSVSKSVVSNNFADNLTKMADTVDANPTWFAGGIGKGLEFAKGAIGAQGLTDMSQIRAQYARMRAQMVQHSMPPGIGRITDSDLRVFGAGIPSETAPPSQQSAFLRTFAKLQRVDAATNDAQAQWAQSVGHMGRPKVDIEVGGVKVPAGTTFQAFLPKYVEQQTKQLEANTNTTDITNAPYFKKAQQAPVSP